jgi:putative Mg2+ transporter-C (MgtC) family protein
MEAGSLSPINLSWLEALARVGAAFAFSLAIGVERFVHRKPVDFRPFVIIAVTSCALAIGILDLGSRATDPSLSIDPAKVMSGVMTGIGFMGAGALFREGRHVEGAGSAASIWAAGAIGIVCGLGFLWLGAIVAVAVVVTLLVSRRFVSDYATRTDAHRDA